jgi:hypothetical protein
VIDVVSSVSVRPWGKVAFPAELAGLTCVGAGVREKKVGPDTSCSPRHPTHFEPSYLGLHIILRRGEHFMPE